MKNIVSFYSKPYLENINSWVDDKSFLLSWELCLKTIGKKFQKPILYTDKIGKEILSKNFNSLFEDIIENNDFNFDSSLYFLYKFYIASIQEDKFVHFDYDCYLWSNLSSSHISDIFFQQETTIKNSDQKFSSNFHDPFLLRKILILPEYWDKYLDFNNRSFKIYQSGVFGGNSNFYKDMWQEYIKIINNNSITYNKIISKTLQDYLPFAFAKYKNIKSNFAVNNINMPLFRFTHVDFEKSIYSDYNGRLTRKITEIDNPKINKISIIIKSSNNDFFYDSVLRCIIPRNIDPNEIFIIDCGMKDSDRRLLSKIKKIKFIKSEFDNFIDIIKLGTYHSNNDLCVFVDGNIKVPKLYIEKAISANLQYKNTIFCASYKEENNNSYFDDNIDTIDSNFCIIDKNIIKKIDFDKIKNIDELSKSINRKNINIKCLKNLIISKNNQKQQISHEKLK